MGQAPQGAAGVGGGDAVAVKVGDVGDRSIRPVGGAQAVRFREGVAATQAATMRA